MNSTKNGEIREAKNTVISGIYYLKFNYMSIYNVLMCKKKIVCRQTGQNLLQGE